MWKATVCVSALMILTFSSSAMPEQPACNAVNGSCDFWGVGLGGSGPYSGYVCVNRDPVRTRTATPQPGQSIQVVDLPNYQNCGLLYTYTWDATIQAAVDLVLVDGPGCGGNQATQNCYEPPSA